MGRLLVGVDVGVPLPHPILLAGLCRFCCSSSSARCCFHGGSCPSTRWDSATLGGSLDPRPGVSEAAKRYGAESSPEPRSRRSRPVLQQWQDLSLEVHACLKVAVHSSSRQAASKGASQEQGREQTPRVGQLQSLMQSQASLVT